MHNIPHPFHPTTTITETTEQEYYLLMRATMRLYIHEQKARNGQGKSVLADADCTVLGEMLGSFHRRWEMIRDGDGHTTPQQTPVSNTDARKRRNNG